MPEILEDDAHFPLHAARREARGVQAVQQDAARGRLKEARQQLDNGGLARAVLPDQRQRLTALHREIHAPQHVPVGQRVTEAHVLKLDGVDGATPRFTGVQVAVGKLQELEQVAHVQQVLVNATDAAQEAGHGALHLRDPQDEHAEIPHADLPRCRPPQDQGTRQANEKCREQGSAEAPDGAAAHDVLQLLAKPQVILAPA